MDVSEQETPAREMVLATVVATFLIAGCFALAAYTQHLDSAFSLAPNVQRGASVPPRDFISADRVYAFHATIYTVWATMILCLPAFCTVWFVRSSVSARSYWLSFWTVGLIAMLVHLYMAMGVLFEWDWQQILKDTTRVTIPVPDLVLTVWWAVDVVLGWLLFRSTNVALYTQRVLLHAALWFIFLVGFIREGEVGISKLIGVASALAVLLAVVVGVRRRKRWAV